MDRGMARKEKPRRNGKRKKSKSLCSTFFLRSRHEKGGGTRDAFPPGLQPTKAQRKRMNPHEKKGKPRLGAGSLQRSRAAEGKKTK